MSILSVEESILSGAMPGKYAECKVVLPPMINYNQSSVTFASCD